jgi:hypothetical protein
VLDLSNATAIEGFFDAVGPLDHLLYLMRKTFVTGQTLVIDGGGLLV